MNSPKQRAERFMHGIYWIWLILTLPGAWLLFDYNADVISYGEAVHRSGLWSAGLLLLALSVTPLNRVVGSSWARILRRHRRAIGVACFGYAALHTGLYLEYKWGAGLILKEGLEASLALGWVALLLFLILAITSNNLSTRILARRWKPLHRLVYIAAVLTFAHWILGAFDPFLAWVFVAVTVALQLLRLMGGGPQERANKES